MASIEPYVQEAARLNREAFVAAHPNSVLLERVEDTEQHPAVFRTSTFTLASIEHEATVPVPQPTYRPYEITKSGSNPWQDKVTIGRAPNNDLVLRYRSVSKLHAHLSKDSDGRWQLADAGSRNGTEVNHARLASSAVLLHPGDAVRIGSIDMIYHEPTSLYDFLRVLTPNP